MTYYCIIERFYRNKYAKRSGLPYMNHIDEGLFLCDLLKYSHEVRNGYMLHPLFQSDDGLNFLCGDEVLNTIDQYTVLLCMEYRNVANAFRPIHLDKRDPNLSPIEDVNKMLIIDKIQNRKDLERHNRSHPEYDKLCFYFRRWFSALGISEELYEEIKNEFHQ